MRTFQAFVITIAFLFIGLVGATAAFSAECKTKSVADVTLYVSELGFKVVDVTPIKDPLLVKFGLTADPNETMLVAAIGEKLGVLIFADKDGCVTATAKGHPDRLRSAVEAVMGTAI